MGTLPYTGFRRARRGAEMARREVAGCMRIAAPFGGTFRLPQGRLSFASLTQAVPVLYLVLGIVLGAGYAVLVPPRQVPDELYHFVRAYGISEGHCLAGPTVAVPLTLQFEGRFDEHVEVRDLARASMRNAIGPLLRQPMNPAATFPVAALNVDVYSCVAYLPAATAIAGVRTLHGSMLEALYAARLLSLLVATVITFCALRILPTGRVLMASIALLPMTLHQAASPSADSLANAVAFLLVAAILRLALDERIVRIGTRTALAIGLLLVVLALTKLNVFLCIPALAIPASKFGGRVRKAGALAAAAVLTFGIFAAWQKIDSAALGRSAAERATHGIDYGGNVVFALQHPWLVAIAARNAAAVWGHDYLAMFVGVLGLLNVRIPEWAWQAALCAVVVAAVTGFEKRLPRAVALTYFAAAAISIVVVHFVTFVSETTLAYRQSQILAGTGLDPGIQGRYYIPYAFALLVPLGLVRVRDGVRIVLAPLALTVVVLTSIVAYTSLYNAYWRSPIVDGARADKLGLQRGGTWLLDTDRALSGMALGAHVRAPARAVVPSARWIPDREIATFRDGHWQIGVVPASACTQAIRWERSFTFGTARDRAVFGDWWGTGVQSAGLFRDGEWILRDPRRRGAVVRFRFGRAGDTPVVGDWNGDGRSKAGIFRRGLWLLDHAGLAQHGLVEMPRAAHLYVLGGSGARPVVGDWTGDGRDKIGVFEAGRWTLDVAGDGNRMTPTHDSTGFGFGGNADTPLVGRWSC